MNRLAILLLFALFGPVVYSQVKNTNEDFQIPNAGLENWFTITVNPSVTYEELGSGPSDKWLGTLNSLAEVPPTAGGPGPVTVFKTTDAHSGNYAAKAISANFPLGMINIFIPGMVGTAVMNNATVSAILGKPCVDCRPSKLTGWYKYQPVNNDSCAAFVVVTKWNSAAGKRDTIGAGYFLQRDAVNEYTKFEIPVTYFSNGPADSLTVLMVASAGMNLVTFTACKGQEGSTMFIDDLALDYPSGFEQVLMPETGVKVSPNPARDLVRFDFTRELKSVRLEVYDAGMKQLETLTVNGRSATVGVTGYPAGSYYFRLLSGNDLVNSGTFLIVK